MANTQTLTTQTTLMDLISVLQDLTTDDDLIVATVADLLDGARWANTVREDTVVVRAA